MDASLRGVEEVQDVIVVYGAFASQYELCYR